MHRYTTTRIMFGVLQFALLSICVSHANAERPPCYRLLPSKTLAYVRFADLQEFGERFNDMSIGRMFQEEELKSLTGHLFKEAETAFTPVGDEIGLSLSEILAIPRGEVAFAVTAPPNGLPAPVLMVDIEGHEAAVVKLMDALERRIERDGNLQKGDPEVERGTKLTIYSQDKDQRYTGLVTFQRDSMLVMTSNLEVAKQILAAWEGDSEQDVLADNDDFADVMRHSKGPREATPQLRWFVDPISFAKVGFRGNFGAQAGLAMLPVLGLDGLLAIGGSVTMASDEYDSYFQLHVITTEPRKGVLSAIALKGGDTTPERWVPHDAASYTTLYWDVEHTRREVEVLYNSFRGEDTFQTEVIDRIGESLELDFKKDILGAMDGRLSVATWYPKPASFTGIALLGGIAIDEESEMEETLRKLIARDDRVQEKSYGGKTIWFRPSDDEVEPDEDDENPLRSKSATPSMAIIGDYLLISNQPEHIERAIVAMGTSGKKLEDELDFKLIASKARRQDGGKMPGLFMFQRPEEGLRVVYDLATAEATKERMANTDNEFFSRLNNQLNEKPLPPFERLRQHFAPNCSFMSADDNGFHFTGFGLRRKK